MMHRPERLWMYCDYVTGRMLAVGTKDEIFNLAKKDFEYIASLRRLAQKTQKMNTMSPEISG